MAENAGAVVVHINAKDSTGKATKSAKGRFKRLGDSIKKMSLASVVGIGALTLAVKKSIDLFGVQEQAEKSLATALGRTSQELLDQASALQKVTTFGDEQIIKAQALIGSFVKEDNQIKAATKATLDLAAAKGMDLTAAADLVSKTLGSSTNALSRYGIEVEGAVGSTERLESLTKNIANVFGGQATAAAQTLTGQMKQMKNQFGDLMETIGKLVAQHLSPLIQSLKGALEWFMGLDKGMQTAIITVGGLSLVLVALAPIIVNVATAIGTLWAALGPAGWLIGGIAVLTTAFIALTPEVKTAADKVADLREEIQQLGLLEAKQEAEDLTLQIIELTGKLQQATVVEKFGLTKSLEEAQLKLEAIQKQFPILFDNLERVSKSTHISIDFGIIKELEKMAEQEEEFLIASEDAQDRWGQGWVDVILQRQQKEKESLDALASLNSEFLLSEEQREIESLTRRFEAAGVFANQNKELIQVFEDEVAAIHQRGMDKRVKQLENEIRQNNAVYRIGIAGYRTFWQNLLSEDKTGAEKRKAILNSMLGAFIDFLAKQLEQLIIKIIVGKTIEKAAQTASIVAANITGRVVAQAWAPAATLASIATFGGAAAAGGAAVVAAVGTTSALAVSGFEKGGIIGNDRPLGFGERIAMFQPVGSDRIPAMLGIGEAVIPARSVQSNRPIIEQLISDPSPIVARGFQQGGVVGDSTPVAAGAVQTIPANENRSEINIHNHFVINAIDGESVRDFVRGNFRDDFLDAISDLDIRLEVDGKAIEAIK